MIGQQLHQYDVALCQYALNNIRGNMDRPAFAAFVEKQLDAPVLTYLKALGGDGEPQPLLLTDMDFYDLADTFVPIEFDPAWVAYEPLHRRHIDCVPEIRAGLAQECAEEWVRASSRFAERLESERTHLSDGIRVVDDWVREARRLLKAMGATAMLPRPEGRFPTPASPEPPPSTSQPTAPHGSNSQLNENMATLLTEVRDLLRNQRTVREFYTTTEAAEALGNTEYTVREWCRLGRCAAEKQRSYRGGKKQWTISHDELVRLQNEGPAPLGTYRLPSSEH